MDRLSSTELLSTGSKIELTSSKLLGESISDSIRTSGRASPVSSAGDSASVQLSNYAADLFQNPGNHIPELGGLVAVIGIGAAIASRRAISQAVRSAFGELGEKAVVSDVVPKAATPVVETFRKMQPSSVADALGKIEARDGVEIASWGRAQIEGSQGAGLSVLRASDLGALRIKKGADTVYAHKISINESGDTVASYYTNSPMNLKNHWVANESLAWPLHANGPFDGLRSAGVEVLALSTKPRGLHFNTKFDSLSIKWTDLQAIIDPSKAGNVSGNSARLFAGKPNSFSSIEVRGKDAVLKGEGQVILSP